MIMTYTEMYKQALEMPIDDLTKKIAFYSTAVGVLTDVKKIRIKDGEQTSEMIRRAKRKSSMSATHNENSHQPKQETVQTTNQSQIRSAENARRSY